ncbi:MAG TPA: radical SAM protein [Dehalococcoidia bacterium]|nr:radical SAM protein [Dehalococcoidia bacterium]
MEEILLVEPDYKNKFPPLGLMKIATYHRNKGDTVEFYKGQAPYTQIISKDRVYITTLFTFHYDITVKCISHYAKYLKRDSIFIGGIAATLMASDFKRDTGINNIIERQLFSSRALGYEDNINIDSLPLDYDILDDISYRYPAGDNYFVHTTRGCPRGCEFCAVRVLEPKFETTNNIIDQVRRVDEIYGKKRNLFVMDNNVLCSPKLREIIEDIRSLGFTGEANYIWPNQFKQMLEKIKRRKKFGVDYSKQLFETVDLLETFANRLKRYPRVHGELDEVINLIKTSDNIDGELETHSEFLSAIVEKYRPRTKMIRYVDFNQGIDARLINKRSMKILSTIPIRPFRLACDSIEDINRFNRATKLAIENNVRHFSNYILYNWKDRPEDLWIRLNNAVSLYSENGTNIDGFSFPMKYAPIKEKDRRHIGEFWNRKYLSAVNVIINVTNGVVAKEKDFFFEAFGSNIEEFFEILGMPDEFIRFRHFFRDNGLIDYWKTLFHSLSEEEKMRLIDVLCKQKLNESIRSDGHSKRVKKMLVLYTLNKSQFDRGERSYQSVVNEVESI